MDELSEKSAVSSSGKKQKVTFSKGASYIALWMVLVASLPASAFAQSSCQGIHVQVPNIRNSMGGLACALFDAPEGFPYEFMRFATTMMMTQIEGEAARCDFMGVQPGSYAIAVIHDENLNGELDTNFLGIPKEGYGFSNEAKAGFSAPSFSAASFFYDGKDLNLRIRLKY